MMNYLCMIFSFDFSGDRCGLRGMGLSGHSPSSTKYLWISWRPSDHRASNQVKGWKAFGLQRVWCPQR